MSTALGSNSASGAMAVSPGRPRLRACTSGVSGGVRAASRARAQGPGGAGGGGIVQHGDEVAGRGGAQPPLDLGPRRQQIGQRDGAEVVAERAPACAAAACSAETPGLTRIATRCQAGSSPRSSSSNARAAMAMPGSPELISATLAAACGQIQRAAHPRLLAEREGVADHLATAAADQIEIAGVADPVVGVVEQRARLGGSPVRAARPQADQRETPWGRPIRGSSGAGARQRAGGAVRSGLADHQLADRPQRAPRPRRRRATGHGKHLGGRIGQTRSLRLQPARREEPGGRAELRGERMDRRLRRLEVERDHAGDRALARDGGAPESRPRGRSARGLDAALAANAEREHPGVDHEAARRARIGLIGDAHLELAAAGKPGAAGGPRGRRGLDRERDVAALAAARS